MFGFFKKTVDAIKGVAPKKQKTISKILLEEILLEADVTYEQVEEIIYYMPPYDEVKREHLESKLLACFNWTYFDEKEFVSPKVQQEASAKILDITAPAEDKSIDINIAISQEERENKTALIDALKEIAVKQREALESGASIEEVQQIGNIIEAKIVDTGDDDE